MLFYIISSRMYIYHLFPCGFCNVQFIMIECMYFSQLMNVIEIQKASRCIFTRWTRHSNNKIAKKRLNCAYFTFYSRTFKVKNHQRFINLLFSTYRLTPLSIMTGNRRYVCECFLCVMSPSLINEKVVNNSLQISTEHVTLTNILIRSKKIY